MAGLVTATPVTTSGADGQAQINIQFTSGAIATSGSRASTEVPNALGITSDTLKPALIFAAALVAAAFMWGRA
tara:strand:- start:5168 stop:5386 length:219 start_codon:yes stop_codon:yes gene_type:complete